MREWRYESTTRIFKGVKLYAAPREDGSWYWDIARNGAICADGNARTEHLAKTYAMRAAKKLLKDAK